MTQGQQAANHLRFGGLAAFAGVLRCVRDQAQPRPHRFSLQEARLLHGHQARQRRHQAVVRKEAHPQDLRRHSRSRLRCPTSSRCSARATSSSCAPTRRPVMSRALRRRCARCSRSATFAGTSELDFVHYELEDPKYDTTECRQRGITYAAPMKVTLRLIVFEVDAETETRSVLDIKEQDVYMGDMPLMTENGTFIINGTERVIVSQMHRSPGVLFDHDRGKTHSSGKFLFAARVIPYRGSWLDFEFDAKDIVNVRIDRKRKLPVTSLLYGLGLDAEAILDHFYETVEWQRGGDGWRVPYTAEQWRGQKPAFDIVDANSGEVDVPRRHQDQPARRQQGGEGRPQGTADPDRRDLRPLFCCRPDRRKHRPHLARGGRRSEPPRTSRLLDKAGIDHDRPARHRPCHHRAVDPQHAAGRQGRKPRDGPGGNLQGDAPRRAADEGNRRIAVRRPVLRWRPL